MSSGELVVLCAAVTVGWLALGCGLALLIGTLVDLGSTRETTVSRRSRPGGWPEAGDAPQAVREPRP